MDGKYADGMRGEEMMTRFVIDLTADVEEGEDFSAID